MKKLFSASILLAIFLLGCTGAHLQNPVEPETRPEAVSGGDGASHNLWGLWQFKADPAEGRLDVTPLRTADMHLNALKFLEPPPFVYITVQNIHFGTGFVDCDVKLRHPFLGQKQFTGFDVCGVLITTGSKSDFADPDIKMPKAGDTRLLNPDGYTRWWNPAEFPHNDTMLGYKDGLMGTPDSTANFSATINPYKLFCDDLTDPSATLDTLDPSTRCVFSAGQENIRHYTIAYGAAGLVFNYAVDACWQFPNGTAPWDVPDDFGPMANRPEAWNAVVTENENLLWNNGSAKGGSLNLSIDLWDHFSAELNQIYVESPGNFPPVGPISPDVVSPNSAGFTVDIPSATPAQGSIEILIRAECEKTGYQDLLPGKTITAYFTHTAIVSAESPDYIKVVTPNGGETWPVSSLQKITWKSSGSISSVEIEYSKDDFNLDIHEITPSAPNTGTYNWFPIPDDPTETAKVRITDTGTPAITDTSDDYFTIVSPFESIYVDDSNDTGYEDGTQAHPYNTINEGMAMAIDGDTVFVDDSGKPYTEQVTLKNGVILMSLNWDITDGGDRATIAFSGGPVSGGTVIGADGGTIVGFLITGSSIGIECDGTSPSILDCHVAHIGDASARGIYVYSGGKPVFNNVKVYDIHDATGAGYATFSGVHFKDCIYTEQFVVSGLEVYNIRTDADSNYCHPTGIRIEGCDNMRLSHNIVHEITTYNPDLGGSYSFPTGIKVEDSNNIHIRSNLIYDIDGGNYELCFGIRYINGEHNKCGNNVIYDVRKNYYYGTAYGISAEGVFDICMKNNVIMNIKGPNSFQNSYGVRIIDSNPICFEYNDVWDCGTDYYDGFTPGVGCFNTEPMLVDPDAVPPDFHLQKGSPCIDKGDPVPAMNDPDGSRNDVGAYGGPFGGEW
jgi:hypothetical protein